MNPEIARHCAELDRCNQRGGRMLSLLDLIDAGTVTLELAAYLMTRMNEGVSFMVGARPGGAGKTTVMCALLNLVPPDVELAPAVNTCPRTAEGPRCCYICHEIGSGPYFAYLWGRELRAYCALAEEGHLLATNLHADDLEQARDQVCGENQVPVAHFNAFQLMLFLHVDGKGYRYDRRINAVYASDGRSEHRLIFENGTLFEAPNSAPERVAACRAFLDRLLVERVRAIEDVREQVLALLK